ncbi:glioma pathogenesis-related protein 1 [Sphaeramia orbicularis]|uniref:Glioma pathogenesis-related protein 1-like n=1 Tax=Sphaeramia orbicularis TaxID=375764 RepID=A0A673CHK5_9TELE|nr:glioma pathogenesis-related protein 1-like [Sphaeramia orbicularis]
MQNMVRLGLWVWIVLGSGVCSVSLPEITDGNFAEQCVKEHNTARSSVHPPASDMLYMTWDGGLAATALAWAKQCVFEHNPNPVHPSFTSIGENIWAGYPPSHFDVSGAIKLWVDEKQHYHYSSNTCTKVCGHYTQVVWASSDKVGCAVQRCPNGVRKTSFDTTDGAVFVCNYAAAGNVNRRRPYQTKGDACSGCKGRCVDRLCRSNWTQDQEPALNSGSDYVAVVVVRPIALICTFIAAYAVHHHYPDIFWYE